MHGYGLRAKRPISQGEEFIDPTVRWRPRGGRGGDANKSERYLKMDSGCFDLCDERYDDHHQRLGGRRSVYFCINESPAHGLAVARAEYEWALEHCTSALPNSARAVAAVAAASQARHALVARALAGGARCECEGEEGDDGEIEHEDDNGRYAQPNVEFKRRFVIAVEFKMYDR